MQPEAPLPAVMLQVLSSWRFLTTDLDTDVDFETVLHTLTKDGYRVRLVDPTHSPD